jgi:hypothetical protein
MSATFPLKKKVLSRASKQSGNTMKGSASSMEARSRRTDCGWKTSFQSSIGRLPSSKEHGFSAEGLKVQRRFSMGLSLLSASKKAKIIASLTPTFRIIEESSFLFNK